MRRLPPTTLFSRYAVAWIYLTGVIVVGLCNAALSWHDQGVLVRWVSTSVANLEHDPALCLVVSAFLPTESLAAWPALIALALFGANHVLGNRRTVLVCATAQVVATLVSEGIVACRVYVGTLPAADRYLLDVGPSYVVGAAIAVAVLYASRLARLAALADLAVFVFGGHIFAGFARLQVSAVGHATALATGAVAGAVMTVRQRDQSLAARKRLKPQPIALLTDPGPQPTKA